MHRNVLAGLGRTELAPFKSLTLSALVFLTSYSRLLSQSYLNFTFTLPHNYLYTTHYSFWYVFQFYVDLSTYIFQRLDQSIYGHSQDQLTPLGLTGCSIFHFVISSTSPSDCCVNIPSLHVLQQEQAASSASQSPISAYEVLSKPVNIAWSSICLGKYDDPNVKRQTPCSRGKTTMGGISWKKKKTKRTLKKVETRGGAASSSQTSVCWDIARIHLVFRHVRLARRTFDLRRVWTVVSSISWRR